MLTRVYLEITNVCNLRCAFCPGTARPPRFMSEAEFSLALTRLTAVTKYLYFHVMGEPLLHPSLVRFLDETRKAGMHAALTTNGVLLPRCGEAILRTGLYKISVSLHSREANHGAHWDAAAEAYFDGCFSFARRAASAGTISVLRLWNGDRADRSAQHTLNDRILERLHAYFPGDWEQTSRGLRLAPLCYLEEEEIFDWPDADAPEEHRYVRCHGTRDHIGVLADGTIVPCCLDGEGKIPLGNIFLDDVESVLASPRFTAMREGFLRGEAVEDLCRHCGYAAGKR